MHEDVRGNCQVLVIVRVTSATPKEGSAKRAMRWRAILRGVVSIRSCRSGPRRQRGHGRRDALSMKPLSDPWLDTSGVGSQAADGEAIPVAPSISRCGSAGVVSGLRPKWYFTFPFAASYSGRQSGWLGRFPRRAMGRPLAA